jgi:L-histidine Nalpha-methyltransferase
VEIVEAAYNDSRGVTAEFNKNILLVLNREVGADFDPDDFDHLAFFDAGHQQVEMHLALRRDVTVAVEALDLVVDLKRGETIRTEICRKFSRSGTRTMLRESGLQAKRWFSDAKEWFSIVEIVRADA